ncbi:MAG: WXG100 family type VII secretion target [Lachnospiraceae bacterium]|nr:WXG100 family type VII secretion target [Lachnospiraceae bacterium]
MALSEYTINFNYNQAIQKAAEIESVTKDLDAAINELNSAISTLKGNWEGMNSQAFVAKCIKEREKIQDTRDDVKKTADAIRKIAAEIKEAELRALAIARAAEEAARKAAELAAAATGNNGPN